MLTPAQTVPPPRMSLVQRGLLPRILLVLALATQRKKINRTQASPHRTPEFYFKQEPLIQVWQEEKIKYYSQLLQFFVRAICLCRLNLFQMFLARLLSKLPKLLPVVLPATRFVLILTETFTAGGEMKKRSCPHRPTIGRKALPNLVSISRERLMDLGLLMQLLSLQLLSENHTLLSSMPKDWLMPVEAISVDNWVLVSTQIVSLPLKSVLFSLTCHLQKHLLIQPLLTTLPLFLPLLTPFDSYKYLVAKHLQSHLTKTDFCTAQDRQNMVS
mmetsp:Transcript_11473/g.16487  ORF Transcript_11473/g.16487 Transcript_11473/m.16487 type:complete len:272 (+) Transcript_11473:32-847(+)